MVDHLGDFNHISPEGEVGAKELAPQLFRVAVDLCLSLVPIELTDGRQIGLKTGADGLISVHLYIQDAQPLQEELLLEERSAKADHLLKQALNLGIGLQIPIIVHKIIP